MTTLVFPTVSDRFEVREAIMQKFAQDIKDISEGVGFRMSSRGWGYQLEGFGIIDKSQLDVVESLINECRKNGLLALDFTMDEEGRSSEGVEVPSTSTPKQFISRYLTTALTCENHYTPDWWENEKYYIQMIVEKIDLKTLFQPICEKFHIPIATSKGWGSILQRAEYGKRFQEAQESGLHCVLLTCGDHDPVGIKITDGIKKNLGDLVGGVWEDGTPAYDPKDLIVDRFGLNYDFIVANNLPWIDNLTTSGGNDPTIPTKTKSGRIIPPKPFVLDYIAKYGKRKCEANAMIAKKVIPHARLLCRNAIEKYLGKDAEMRFSEVRKERDATFTTARQQMAVNGVSLDTLIRDILKERTS
jgi:hypothetical protein